MFTAHNTFKYAPIALLLIASSVQAKTINKEFNVSNGGLLKITTDVGAIDIESHNKETVLVEVIIKGKNEEDMKVSFDNSGNNVSINGDFDRSGFSSGNNNIRVTYKVTLPQNYNVDLDTSGGSIEIEDLKGKIDAHTSGGSISVEDIEGEVDIKTSGGSLDIENIIGAIDAHTSGGSIKVKLPNGPTQDSKIKTSGGSITAYLSKDVAIDLFAKTSGGRVSSEFTVNGKTKKNAIDGTINGGGVSLVLKTNGGSVRIKEI
jgi:hypothetical protein